MTEEAAKAAWLARLDAPSWGQASTTMSEVAGQAAALLALTEDCDSGVEAACDSLSREEEAKRAWLQWTSLVQQPMPPHDDVVGEEVQRERLGLFPANLHLRYGAYDPVAPHRPDQELARPTRRPLELLPGFSGQS